MKWLKDLECFACHRLKEPSTWAALSVPFSTWGTQLPNPYNYWAYTAAGVCGILAILLKEKPHVGKRSKELEASGRDGVISKRHVSGPSPDPQRVDGGKKRKR